MHRFTLRTGFFLAVDIALLALCLLHIPRLLNRPRSPFDVTETNGRILVEKILDESACPGLQVGDTVGTWNNQHLTSEHNVEFLADFCSIGDSIRMTYAHFAGTRTTDIRLIAAYGLTYVIIVLFIGIVAWGVGVFVLIRRPGETTATVLHWAMVMMGVSVMITWGQTSPAGNWMYISRTLFFVTYAAVAATFLHLTALFPIPRSSLSLMHGAIIYLPLSLLAGGMIYFHTLALSEQSLRHFNTFQTLFDAFHIALVVYVGAGIVQFIKSYFRSASFEERRKLKWILWGLTVGPLPFLLLTMIPQYYLRFGFLPEEYTLIFLTIIPLAFGISFIKYHLLDIEVVINRTTVYGIVLSAVVTLYIILIGTLAAFVGAYTVGTSVAAAVIVALVFEPVRRRVQLYVDRKFFRVRYNFREALHRFADDIKACIDAKQLADLLIARTEEIIPVERIGVFLLRQADMRLYVVSQRGFELLERRTVRFHAEKLRTQLLLPVALDSRIESGVVYEPADQRVFDRWGMALVFPMKSATGEFVGFFILGAKKSGERFRIEDVDLLLNAATEAGLEFERIALQRKLVEEQAEKQRLEELNQLKSDFVSYVSHELKTPLTSIKLFSELLTKRLHARDGKSHEYVEVIEGETDRLNRMVTTILDSARIDKGIKQYSFKAADLAEIASGVLATMKYQLDKNQFKVSFTGHRRVLPISADPDAVAEAIMNLISNSIKYSAEKKVLKVALGQVDGFCFCRVEDRGRGISPEAIPHLFEKFYRDPASRSRIEGVGLGLSVVKHIMDAHGGRVGVQSEPKRGSAFTLLFPLRDRDHEEKKKGSHRRR